MGIGTGPKGRVVALGWEEALGKASYRKDSELNSEKTRSAGQADKGAIGVLGSVSGSQNRNENNMTYLGHRRRSWEAGLKEAREGDVLQEMGWRG